MMKKVLAFLLISAMLLFSLTACGENGGNGDTENNSQQESQSEDTSTEDTSTEDTSVEDTSSEDVAVMPTVNVISRYTFEGIDGTTVPDSGANGYNGATFGSPEVVEGKFGSALKLSGQNGAVIPVGAGTVGQKFTVSAWIKIEAGSASRPYRILSTGVWGDNTTGFQLGIDTSYGKGCFVYCVGNENGPCYWNRQTEFAAPIMDGQWHHVAIAFDMDAMLACGYLDGVLMDIMVLPASSNVTPWSALTELSIGGAYVGGVLGESFIGTVDEVCVTDYFFTEADIEYLMNNTIFE